MPMVDRGGGRESKNHERRVKRGLNAKANPFDKKDEAAMATLAASPQATRLPIRKRPESIIDCGCNLISRQLARDQTRMLSRAFDGGVDGVITFCTDFDRIEEVQTLVKSQPGSLFGAYGMHPDNVKRSNEKDLQKKLGELKAAALTPECVAIFCGLDFSRDMGSHFPQERLLDSQFALASEVKLPVIITVTSAADRVAEKVAEWQSEYAKSVGGSSSSTPSASSSSGGAGSGGTTSNNSGGNKGDGGKKKVGNSNKNSNTEDNTTTTTTSTNNNNNNNDDENDADGNENNNNEDDADMSNRLDSLGRVYTPRAAIFAFDGDAKALKAYLDADCYIILTGAVCDSGAGTIALRSLIPSIPLDRLLVASDAPLSTPQNIRDEAIRTTRNEPSNLPFILPTLVDAYNTTGTTTTSMTQKDMALILYKNSCAFFGLEDGATVDWSSSSSSSNAAAVAEESPSGSNNTGAATTGTDDTTTTANNEDADAKASSSTTTAVGAATSTTTTSDGNASSNVMMIGAGGGGGGAGAGDAHGTTTTGDQGATTTTAMAVVYRCRVCRAGLFTDSDVMPHDSTGLRPSAKALAAAAAHGGIAVAPKAIASGTIVSTHSTTSATTGNNNNSNNKKKNKNKEEDIDEEEDDEDGDADGGNNSNKRKGGKGKKAASNNNKGSKVSGKGKKAGRGGGDSDDSDEDNTNNKADTAADITEVAVGRWHEAKGKQVRTRDQGMCRMLLIEKQPWITVSAGEPEGVILCVGCQGKIGQYNLSGIKCGCGLLVTPAFKIPKNRVDAELQGVDALEMAMLAMDVKERGGVSALGVGEEDDIERGDLSDDDKDERRRERRKRGPVSKHRGNFSLFRDKET